MTDVRGAGIESDAPDRGTPRVDRFPCFDGLRALAACSVVLTHVSFVTGTSHNRVFGAFLARADIGVAIFFLISGFLLYRPFVAARLADRPGPAVTTYLGRRALRIFPGYWLAVAGAVVLIETTHFANWRELFGNLFLVYTYFFGFLDPPAALAQSWTLCVEISFYAFLPLWAVLLRRVAGRGDRTEWTGLGLLYLAGFAFRGLAHGGTPSFGIPNLWLSANLDLFALGMGLAVLHAHAPHWPARAAVAERLGRVPAGLWWALAVASFWTVSTRLDLPRGLEAVTLHQELARQFLYGLTALFLLIPAIFGDQRHGILRQVLRSRLAAVLGLVSYGIYLWHFIALDVSMRLLDQPWYAGRFGVALVVTAALTAVAATASYVLVERPAVGLGRRFSRR